MALLGSVAYDPGTAASMVTDTLTAMTAIDTTNLRITFTAPANGKVLVRLQGSTIGSASVFPRILLGVLDGSTVKGRISPGGQAVTGAAAATSAGGTFLVTGLTPSSSYTWDAAMAVDVVQSSTALKYGGPDTTSGADAWGAFVFDIWDTTNLLAGTLYDPSSAGSKATTSLLAMTAMDTTNLRLSFTAPASGKVLWRIRAPLHGAANTPEILLGVMSGASVVARTTPVRIPGSGASTTLLSVFEASGVVTGLSGAYTWDAAYGVQIVVASTAIKYGGPNTTTTNDAFGGIAFEVWDPTTAPTTASTYLTGMIPI